MDLTQIQTNTGKTLADFTVPPSLLENDQELVRLILLSESMNDDERQYWFNLTEIMSDEQVEKLRGILVRERQKLKEIEEKYSSKDVDPEEAKRRALESASQRVEKQQELKAKEAEAEAKEKEEEESILGELDNV